MSLIGFLSTGRLSHASQVCSVAVPEGLSPLLACDLNGFRLALWGHAACALSGTAAVLLDGRIFNAADLAAQLQVSSLDQPGLLLRAYQKWGAEFPKYLQGEFALA